MDCDIRETTTSALKERGVENPSKSIIKIHASLNLVLRQFEGVPDATNGDIKECLLFGDVHARSKENNRPLAIHTLENYFIHAAVYRRKRFIRAHMWEYISAKSRSR